MEMNNVRALLNKHWDRRLPVDPMKLAHALGMQVKHMNPFNMSAEDFGISGYAAIENGQQVVAYNTTEHPNRQRFTVAHEIGHHLLGHVSAEAGRRLRDNASNYSANINKSIELEANEFAAQLIMPEDAVRTLIERNGITSIRALADAFSVSEAAMYYRLKNLGLTR
ncbi:ImmA/IrrE family metallo-endopeptidase [Aeromonas veronii]|uniref:ImmA/IrrE family metallo-endopeptidase n=1 Tax=Aeromonas veronii TaxID=654 RepID=UPI003670AD0C